MISTLVTPRKPVDLIYFGYIMITKMKKFFRKIFIIEQKKSEIRCKWDLENEG